MRKNTREEMQMKKMFSIGEVAKIKDITIKALRYYHKMGILIPKHVDESTGYRYYSIDQFIHIDIIKSCRELNTSIVELQEIFKECNTDKLLRFLQLKREEAEEHIKKMKEVMETIDDLHAKVVSSQEILKNDEISIEFFEQRYVVVAPCKEVGSLQELLYYSDLEKIVQDYEEKMEMEMGILYNVNEDWDVEPKYVFNKVRDDVHMEEMQNIKVLPGGKYITLAYSKENEEERRNTMIKYMKENSIEVESFIEVELVSDIFNAETYSCQIQILIGDSENKKF
ncbi:MerR family transcriptional regulator [Bacillus wiedmannii]|uniref:MerR family transcriptional regulator n=1 Tax=Bacillus TaxID=1386 RepID=UPI000BEB35C6|nr:MULTISPECIES: helix-turn-helix domain-containing protein [Bacillus]AZJ19071.1 MerR family transcriptional regulator [Bacillus wiedmannii bv. thuringiensis]MBJ8109959.1 MerR family DNA-binding transcriptional regulator [Bacillus cereus group sp. N6]MCU5496582.1 helix-turn-helix domain-containing protein [Bacillus wiedmannii]MED2882480.1 helix-turn-helix domain-containing protein [Bacillus wiedmannii]PEC57853.1 MerR family transcriptional regulator [Bacillus wiedmannii]